MKNVSIANSHSSRKPRKSASRSLEQSQGTQRNIQTIEKTEKTGGNASHSSSKRNGKARKATPQSARNTSEVTRTCASKRAARNVAGHVNNASIVNKQNHFRISQETEVTRGTVKHPPATAR